MGARPWLATGAVAVLLVAACSANTVKVSGDSMAPALKDGDIKLVDTGAYGSSSPKRGDIVQYHHNQIGRVIGLPGEKVTIANGKVSINGSVLSEPYLATGTQTTAPQDTYLVPARSTSSSKTIARTRQTAARWDSSPRAISRAR